MQVAEIEVQLSSGEVVPLASLYAEQPVALVFLRHLGCIFCREHVAQLRRLKDLNIVFVTLGTPEQTEAFRTKMQSPHRFICDPDKTLYRHFEIPRGGLTQMMSPQVFVRAIGATLQGHRNGRSDADPLQLPGVFVIGTDGVVTWQYRSKNASDNAPPDEIERHLQA